MKRANAIFIIAVAKIIILAIKTASVRVIEDSDVQKLFKGLSQLAVDNVKSEIEDVAGNTLQEGQSS